MGMHAHAKSPTQILREEHEVILRAVDGLEGILGRIEQGGEADAAVLAKAVDFIRGFADGRHHEKEEALLFPAIAEAGVPTEGGPVGVMLAEHEEGRRYVRGLAEGIARLGPAPEEARRAILDHGRAYVQLLRAHIMKENEILFPLADRVIPADAMHGLTHAFEHAEAEGGEGEHRRFLDLAAELARGGRG